MTYRKPPMKHRFKPGQSGNPRGRPRKRDSLLEQLKRKLYESVSVRDGAQIVRMKKLDAILSNMITRSCNGDARAMSDLIKWADRVDLFKDDAQSTEEVSNTHEAAAEFRRRIELLAERLRAAPDDPDQTAKPEAPDEPE